MKVFVWSNILLVRGFGSSVLVIVVGIELVNVLCDLCLLKREKFCISSLMEGYFDNVSFFIYGGIVVGYYYENEIYIV